MDALPTRKPSHNKKNAPPVQALRPAAGRKQTPQDAEEPNQNSLRLDVETLRATTTPHPFARRAHARAKLTTTLAQLFGYPSFEQAKALVQTTFLEECRITARKARVHLDEQLAASELLADGRIVGIGRSCQGGQDQRDAQTLRIECTRLFWTYPRPVHLEGRYWVAQRGRGESHAVAECYRALGLRNKPGVTAPADSLASELDYVSYVLRAEAAAWDGEDSASALEWHNLYEDFIANHLGPQALGVAAALETNTNNPHLRFYSLLLHAACRLD